MNRDAGSHDCIDSLLGNVRMIRVPHERSQDSLDAATILRSEGRLLYTVGKKVEEVSDESHAAQLHVRVFNVLTQGAGDLHRATRSDKRPCSIRR